MSRLEYSLCKVKNTDNTESRVKNDLRSASIYPNTLVKHNGLPANMVLMRIVCFSNALWKWQFILLCFSIASR